MELSHRFKLLRDVSPSEDRHFMYAAASWYQQRWQTCTDARKGCALHLELSKVVIEQEDLPEHLGKTKIMIGDPTGTSARVWIGENRMVNRTLERLANGWASSEIEALMPW